MNKNVGVNIDKDLANVLRARKIPRTRRFQDYPNLQVEYYEEDSHNTSEDFIGDMFNMVKEKTMCAMDSMKNLFTTISDEYLPNGMSGIKGEKNCSDKKQGSMYSSTIKKDDKCCDKKDSMSHSSNNKKECYSDNKSEDGNCKKHMMPSLENHNTVVFALGALASAAIISSVITKASCSRHRYY